MKLLGLSGKAGAGKDSAFLILKRLLGDRVVRVAFADGVKAEAMAVGWNGLKDEAGRRLLQEIGAGRREQDPSYWIVSAFKRMATLPADSIVVISDARYKNEAMVIREAGGALWRIERTNPDMTPFDNGLSPEAKAHPSETDLDNYVGFQARLFASNLEELEVAVTDAAAMHELGREDRREVGAGGEVEA